MSVGLNPLPFAPIVDGDGRPSAAFMQWWETIRTVLLAVPEVQEAIAAANGQIADNTSGVETAQARADAAYSLADGKVTKDAGPAFAAPAGPVSRATLPDYAAPTIGNPPAQADVQAMATQLQVVTRSLAAVEADLIGNGALGG